MHVRRQYSPYGYKKVEIGWVPLDATIASSKELPGREPVVVGIKQECSRCNLASHGFMCHFSDGTCLKTSGKVEVVAASAERTKGEKGDENRA